MKARSVILTATLCASCNAVIGKEARPNVLLVVVDDYGWNDVGCYGSDYYETPNIDAIAKQGVRFTNNYAGCSVSSPSRASLLTGKSPARHGITSWIGDPQGEAWRKGHKDMLLPASYTMQLPLDEYTLAEAMRDGGYATYFVGKWHLGSDVLPTDSGFDVNIGGWSSGSPKGGYYAPYINPAMECGEDGENLTMRLSEEAVNLFAKSEERADKPFFMMLCYYAVHGPIETDKQRWDHFRKKAIAQGFDGSQDGFKEGRRLPVRMNQDNPVYAGLVNQMDVAVGRVMRGLKEQGLDKNTIVIFTSDNGGVVSGDAYSTSLAPLRGGKGNQWEGGIRVPLIIYNPMDKKSSVVNTPVIGMDIYPTVLDYAALPSQPSQHCDGVSIRPLLEGKKIAERELFWHYPHYGNQGGEPSSIVRDGDWKLIYYHEDQRMELYNLAKDISETTDLSKRETKRVSEMRKSLDNFLKSSNAKMPQRDPLYNEEEGSAWRANRNETMKSKQEALRKNMLKADWQPNKSWWDSQVTVD